MKTAIKNKDSSEITKAIYKSQLKKGDTVHEKQTHQPFYNDIKWQIDSITETEINNKVKLPIMNGTNGKVSLIEEYSHRSSKEPNKNIDNQWEIGSIHTVDFEDDIDPMTSQVPFIQPVHVQDSNIRATGSFNKTGIYEIQSISVANKPRTTQITDQEWDIRSINTQDDVESSKDGTLFLEESWTEHHSIPILSSSIQIRKPDKTNQTALYNIGPINRDQADSKSVNLNNSQIKNQDQLSRSDVITDRLKYELGRDNKDRSKQADYYTYRYEDNTKIRRLQELANSNDNRKHNNVYNSFKEPLNQPSTSTRTSKAGLWPTTNCMKQSIHVDNDDEEILGIPLILDEYQNPIKNLPDTRTFNSITENVSFQIHDVTAQMTIEIRVEMFHNADPRRQMWKRKQVKVTRLVELDLSKVQDRYRLQDIIDTCNVNKQRIGWDDQQQLEREKKLTGNDAYRVFYNLMAITHEEENEKDCQENMYLTRSPSGHLTTVICEPQFLLSSIKERECRSPLY